MRIIQIKWVLFYLLLQFPCLYCPVEAYFTLADLLNADPAIPIQKPSLSVPSSLQGKKIKIKEEEYQIRSFVFEARPMDDPNTKELTFLQFAEENKLLETLAAEYKPQFPPVSPRASLYPTYSFLKSFEKGNVWFHYMIVLGKAKD